MVLLMKLLRYYFSAQGKDTDDRVYAMDSTDDGDNADEELDPLWNSQFESNDMTCQICATNDTDAMTVDR